MYFNINAVTGSFVSVYISHQPIAGVESLWPSDFTPVQLHISPTQIVYVTNMYMLSLVDVIILLLVPLKISNPVFKNGLKWPFS